MQIFVIDVAGGDDIPRKGGPGIARADLLVINKTDLAPYVGADAVADGPRGLRAPRRRCRCARSRCAATARTGRGLGARRSSPRSAPTATSTRPWKACPITTTITCTERGFRALRRGERIAPRVLAPGRITLLRSQAGPLAGDHDRVEIVVESGTLTVEPIAANVALPGPERTVLELDVTVGEGARLVLEDAPLMVAEGADVLRTTTIRLAPGAVAIVRDVVILGRAGEGPGRLESVLRCDGILHDALRVDPETWARGRVRRARARAPRDRDLREARRARATCTGLAIWSGCRRAARPSRGSM